LDLQLDQIFTTANHYPSEPYPKDRTEGVSKCGWTLRK
jgi:hypothetical protein